MSFLTVFLIGNDMKIMKFTFLKEGLGISNGVSILTL